MRRNCAVEFLDPRLPDRFWSKVVPDPMGGCWIWAGAVTTSGYGQRHAKGSYRSTHREAYETLIGAIPKGLQLDHLCRVRCCVNPAHMEPVTQSENIRRSEAGLVSAARQLAKRSCPKGHAYEADNLYVRPTGR